MRYFQNLIWKNCFENIFSFVLIEDVIVYPHIQPKTILDGLEVVILLIYGNIFNITLNFTIEENIWGDLSDNPTDNDTHILGNGVYGNVAGNKHNAAIGK